MKILSVNVSLPKTVEYKGREVRTGIYKEPVEGRGRVMLRRLNLDGDGQGDLTVHGGVDKAAYAYSIENYEYWQRELGRADLAYGQFGENFTVEGMTDDVIRIGDVFDVGNAKVEVSQPRAPCYKLAMKMEMPEFLKLFLASRRTGFYFRVLEEGDVGAGDEFELVERDPPPQPLSVDEVVRLTYFERGDLEASRAALRVRALSPGWRSAIGENLEKAGAGVDRPQIDDDCGSGKSAS